MKHWLFYLRSSILFCLCNSDGRQLSEHCIVYSVAGYSERVLFHLILCCIRDHFFFVVDFAGGVWFPDSWFVLSSDSVQSSGACVQQHRVHDCVSARTKQEKQNTFLSGQQRTGFQVCHISYCTWIHNVCLLTSDKIIAAYTVMNFHMDLFFY